VIAILLPNSIDFIVAYLGIIHSGHIALPLDPAYKSLELDNIVEQIPPKMIITNEEYQESFTPQHRRLVVPVSRLDGHGRQENHDYIRLNPKLQSATLTFTSGTTGKPKAVPNTHANHIWNIETCSKAWDWTDKDSLLVSLPLSHMHGIVICLSGAIYHGNTLYLQTWFDEKETLQALSSGQITIFTHAASAYVKLVQAGNAGYDLSAVRLCISGAAPLPPAVWQEFKRQYGIGILETYGSSETGRIAGNRLDERVLGSPGKPLPGVDLKLSPEGEVLVKSGGVFPGYFNNPEATRASLTPDGYWRTGDLAELKNGYLFLKGRIQERIRRFGYTVSPRDVEWALHKHPDVVDIFVMGRQVAGEPNDRLIYFIVTSLSVEEILSYCKQQLLFAWRPDMIIKMEELPRTRSGKPKVGQLKKMAK